jgi:hypothetical protein
MPQAAVAGVASAVAATSLEKSGCKSTCPAGRHRDCPSAAPRRGARAVLTPPPAAAATHAPDDAAALSAPASVPMPPPPLIPSVAATLLKRPPYSKQPAPPNPAPNAGEASPFCNQPFRAGELIYPTFLPVGGCMPPGALCRMIGAPPRLNAGPQLAPPEANVPTNMSMMMTAAALAGHPNMMSHPLLHQQMSLAVGASDFPGRCIGVVPTPAYFAMYPMPIQDLSTQPIPHPPQENPPASSFARSTFSGKQNRKQNRKRKRLSEKAQQPGHNLARRSSGDSASASGAQPQSQQIRTQVNDNLAAAKRRKTPQDAQYFSSTPRYLGLPINVGVGSPRVPPGALGCQNLRQAGTPISNLGLRGQPMSLPVTGSATPPPVWNHQRPQIQCLQCGYQCSRLGHLDIHMRSHTGVRPYPCEFCYYRSGDKSNLKKHTLRRHMTDLIGIDTKPSPEKRKLYNRWQPLTASEKKKRQLEIASSPTSLSVLKTKKVLQAVERYRQEQAAQSKKCGSAPVEMKVKVTGGEGLSALNAAAHQGELTESGGSAPCSDAASKK